MKQLFRECLATVLTAILIIGLLPKLGDASRRLLLPPPLFEEGLQGAVPSLIPEGIPLRQVQPLSEKRDTAAAPLLSALMVPPPRQASSSRASEAPVFEALPGQVRTILPDGRWLITGGQGANGPEDSAWLLDSSGIPAKLSKGLLHARAWHTATTLPDGTVLVLGGVGAATGVETNAELFTPETLKFEGVNGIDILPRARHTATLMMDGRVLLAGGAGEAAASLEYLDTLTMRKVGDTGTLKASRQDHTAKLFASGLVQLSDGSDSFGNALPFGESIDPATNFNRFEASADDPSAVQPIRLEASVPQNDAAGVSVGVRLAIRFSRSISPASLTPASVVLSSADGVVPVRAVAAEGGMLAFVRPATALQEGTRYTLAIQGLFDSQGSALPMTSLVFTTDGVVPDNSKERQRLNADNSAEHLPPLQAPPGVTALSGRALTLNGQPLQGVTFRIDDKSAKTDGTGRFLLTGLSAGHHELIIDGRTVRAPETYGVFEVGVDIIDGRTTVLGYTVWMTALDVAHAVNLRFPLVTETVITNPLLPGLELHLPAGTTITDVDGNVASQVSITPIPVKQPPFPLPNGGVDVPLYFTVQPGGGYIHVAGGGYRGGRLLYPNTTNSPPNTVFNFWNYDPAGKGWFIYGNGKVSADRSSIIPDPGVEIHELTGAMVIGGFWGASSAKPPGGKTGGDPVDPSTGLFVYSKTDLSISDVIPISVNRTYRQSDNRSRSFGIGTTVNYDMFLVGNTVPYSYQELVLPDGGRVRFDRITPGWNLTNLVYKNTSTLGEFFGATITHTFFRWVLTRRDGTVFLFKEALDFSGPRDTALLSITDRNGNIVTIDRRSDNTISRVTSPNGRYIDFTYDTSQRITHLQDNIGREVDYVYDAAGRLTQVTDVNDGVWVYDYDPANRMTGIHDARNILYLQNQYDANDRVILQTQADNGTYEFDYTTDANGVITQTDITDPRGHVRRLVFYVPPASPNGFVSGGYDATDTFAYGTSLESTLTTLRQVGTNLPISRTDSSGRVTSLTYDSQGNVTSVTRLAGTPNAITSRFTHDATFGKITSVTDPLNHTTTFSYDTHGNLVSALDPLGNRTSWTYNAAGQVLTATDPNGNTTTFGYTAGNLTSITDPLGRSVSFTYDNVGRRLTTSTSQGISAQEYNSLNLVTRITDPLLGVTDLTYDGNGNVLTVKDARNNTTTYTYNNMDRLETRQDSLLAMENFLYDAKGSLTQATDRRGKITTYTYDELDRPVFVGFGTQVGPTYESSIAFTYDTASRLNVLTDSVAGIMTRDYDDLDRLISETTSAGIVSYSYDDADRRSSATVTGQPTIQYTYDDADRLTLIEQGSSTVAFAYDAGGRRTSLTLPSGIVTRYSYDAASQLIELAYQAGSTPLGDLTYGYDSQGQRIAMGGAYAQTSLPNPLSSATYNINNQLTDWGGNPHSYDANGNLLSDGTNTYTWNARNELSSITGGVTANFQYDPFGRRRSKSVGGNVTDYLYDGANIIQELDGSTPVANLLVGDVDELFRRTEASGFSDVLADALGSPIALLDSELSIQTRYIYGPFGDTTVSGIGNSNSAQFTGRENDGTGLYYYRARYYSPTSQRFLSEDPIEFSGGQVNLYSYVGSDPISFTDPTGECAPWCIGAAIGGGMDLAIQLIENGGNIKCVNWWSVAGNAALGALGGGLGGKALTGYLRGLNMQSKKVIGETLSLVENRLKFARLVSQNRKSIPGFGTIVDSTWDSFRGARYYVESKFGTSPLSKLQKIAAANLPPEVYHVERWGYPFFERVGAYVGGTTGAIVGEEMPGRGCGCQ